MVSVYHDVLMGKRVENVRRILERVSCRWPSRGGLQYEYTKGVIRLNVYFVFLICNIWATKSECRGTWGEHGKWALHLTNLDSWNCRGSMGISYKDPLLTILQICSAYFGIYEISCLLSITKENLFTLSNTTNKFVVLWHWN